MTQLRFDRILLVLAAMAMAWCLLPVDSSAQDDSLEVQIAQLAQKVEQVEAKIQELVFVKDSEERDKLKKELAILKRQLRGLLVRKQMSARSQYEVGAEQIRNRYADKIKGVEHQKASQRAQSITKFEKILDGNPDSKLAADIVFRLGLLYFEEDHYQYQRRQDQYLKQVDQLVARGQDTEIGFQPSPDYTRAQGMFQRVTTEFSDFRYADGAHYLLAFCQAEEDDLDAALKTYLILIAKYPKSVYVPEARIRMGELYFDNNDMAKAIEQYKEVLKYPDSNFYDKALFKLGWSYYRLTASDPASLATAVRYFTEVLDFYQNRPRARLRGGDDLRSESIDYIAISFTDMDDGGIPEARKFADKHPEYKWNKDIYTKMAEVYLERDRYDEARNVIDERVQRWPADADNPKIHLRIVDALVTLGRYEEAIEVGERIAALYGPETEWAKANQGKKTVIDSTNRQRSKLLFASATFHHESAQKVKKDRGSASARPQFEKAAQSYETFLVGFTDSKETYEATFNLAECYFELNQYDKAAVNYSKVMAMKKDEELYASAIKNNMYSREQLFLADPGWPVEPQKDVDAGQGERAQIDTVPLSPNAETWVSTMEQHLQLLSDDKDSPSIAFKIGEVYFYHGQFDSAAVKLKDQIARYPESDAAQVSMNLVIQALDRQGKYEDLRLVAADYKNRVRERVIDEEKGVTNLEILDRIEVGAGAKLAEQRIKDGQLQEGINEYLTLANKNPRSDKAPLALHNAAATYRQMGKVYEANDLYLRIARDYPKFEHAKKNLFFASTEYEKMIDFDRAVSTYRLYATTYPDDKYAKDALYNAALLRENNREYDAAISLYQDYLLRYSDSPDVGEVRFTIAKLHRKNGNDGAAEAALAEFTETSSDAVLLTRAYVDWGTMSRDRGSYDEARRHYLQAAAVYMQASQVDPEAGAAYAAEAKFRIAGIEYDMYEAIKLDFDMEKQLLAKAEAYKKLAAMYKEIVQIGNFEWATAALFMIGKINKEFADTLFSAPIPEELAPEEQDVYIVKLEEMAFPLKKKSIDAFETNINKGAAEKLRNEWIDLSYDELKSYKPEIVEEKYELYLFDTAAGISMPDFGTTVQSPPPVEPVADEQPPA
jgi:TolA-binding protein